MKTHFSTLKEDAKTRFIVLLFFAIPITISLILVYFEKLLNRDSVDVLIPTFAIFTGLLFNIIILILDSKNRIQGNTSQEKNRKILLVHLFSNTLYSLLISTVVLILLITAAIVEVWNDDPFLAGLSFLIFALVVHFLITLLMIFKRLSVLLTESRGFSLLTDHKN